MMVGNQTHASHIWDQDGTCKGCEARLNDAASKVQCLKPYAPRAMTPEEFRLGRRFDR